MKGIKGVFPVFKALMAIVYIVLGAVILVKSNFLLPDHSTISKVFGLILVLYGIIRAYTSFVDYSSVLKERHDEEL
jgi:uncharacterized membrane protein HdeD (DUF308 family)